MVLYTWVRIDVVIVSGIHRNGQKDYDRSDTLVLTEVKNDNGEQMFHTLDRHHSFGTKLKSPIKKTRKILDLYVQWCSVYSIS